MTVEAPVSTILFDDVKQTYRGKTGCACGCNGDYFYPANESHAADVQKHFKHILRAIKAGTAEFFGNGIEIANGAYTRVTRIYFNEGVYYYTDSKGNITREAK